VSSTDVSLMLVVVLCKEEALVVVLDGRRGRRYGRGERRASARHEDEKGSIDRRYPSTVRPYPGQAMPLTA